MSPSDGGAPDIRATLAALEERAGRGELGREDVCAMVSAATRVYASASDRAGEELPPLEREVSATDALTLACALLRSQDLTPFDMAVWFARGPRSA